MELQDLPGKRKQKRFCDELKVDGYGNHMYEGLKVYGAKEYWERQLELKVMGA